MTAAPYQIFPDLEPAVEAALRESIRHFGVVYPAVVDQHGQVIDGHHRLRIASEENVDCPTILHEVDDDDEAAELAFTLNADRRQIPAEHRRAIVATLRKQGHSLRAIAGAVGSDKRTVQRDLKSTGATAPVPERVTGLDGKTRPGTRPADELEARRSAAAKRKAAKAADDAELAAVKKAAGLDGPIDPSDLAEWRERDAILGKLVTSCRRLLEIGNTYSGKDVATRWSGEVTWPRTMPDVIAARDWLNDFTKAMGY